MTIWLNTFIGATLVVGNGADLIDSLAQIVNDPSLKPSFYFGTPIEQYLTVSKVGSLFFLRSF